MNVGFYVNFQQNWWLDLLWFLVNYNDNLYHNDNDNQYHNDDVTFNVNFNVCY